MVKWSYDEVVLAADLVATNNWRARRASETEVGWLSSLLRSRSALLHPGIVLEKTSRSRYSVQRKTYDIVSADSAYKGKPTRHSKLDSLVAAEFRSDFERMHARAVAIRHALESSSAIDLLSYEPAPDRNDTDIDFFREGGVLERIVRSRERSRSLRQRKIATVVAGGGPIACEACGFDFAEVYGARGAGYIEVHHVLPLHVLGETVTSMADLSLLCSNCHRMCHRGAWITPDEVSALVDSSRRANR